MTVDWRPTATFDTLRLRARLLQRIREFFAAREVLEVETPALSAAATPAPHLESLATRFTGPGAPDGRTLHLHTSPEFPMKRLLASGSGPIYQIARVFRDAERGRAHNPEFTMLEWYRTDLDHHGLMGEVEGLLETTVGAERALGPPERITYREAFGRHAGVDPFTADAAALARALTGRGLEPGAMLAAGRHALIDLVATRIVHPALGRGGPTLVYDFPADQAQLARVRDGDPPVAERFEVFIDGIEIANGFHELADADEQRRRFEADNVERRRGGRAPMPVDERLLAALAHGLPDCAGVALGLDRLAMITAGARSIDAVIAFPVERA